ncbi:IgGFc-binding protein [Nannocystis sp. ILAH1]|uniref:IgGFc-binding protein n=1 Tax=unclassified Nannocystis TaxID=2627009 RepID=UPI00226DAE7E|nr:MULTISPECIES: IgGFc-binding protein [unclassified Nannocystis]MCY0993828.1 IgGFc-binding protein [Nannocystis sp. ILAH1]MCY1065808.1 IgGFc-binding protein [Nannocystis sp. RBIL2]
MHRFSLPLTAFAIALVGCGDDDSAVSASQTQGTTATTTAPDTQGTATTDAAPTTSTTDASGTGTASDSTTTPSTTTDASTTTTTSETGVVSTTTDTTTGTTDACTCNPGDISGCDRDGQQLVCQDDCQTVAPEPCPGGGQCVDGACPATFCNPGQKVCEGEDAYKECNEQGDAWLPPVDCAPEETCAGGQCLSLCSLAEETPSSVGCSFFAVRQDNYDYANVDSLVVGNTSKTKTASVQLYFTPDGTNNEQPSGAPTNLLPGVTLQFQLTNPTFNKTSALRKGGVYRVQSSIPIVAYQHSPITAQATNDSSMLLPEHALRQDHVITAYGDTVFGEDRPSYFNIVATADTTVVQWTPPIGTVAGAGVPAVAANQTGTVTMNRFDVLQVRAPNDADLSGTFVHGDKPIWVIGAVNCANVPANVFFCDHLEEQVIPLDYWGKQYIGAHSPKRGSEKHYWRVYAGEDQTTITTTPAQPGTPFTLNKGQWKELVIPNNTSFVFDGDKPFMPVQYLEGESGGAGTGDPAMYQMVPVEQFLDRYAFVTGIGYDIHFAQIIRLAGNPDVVIDGQVVAGYYAVGGYEVADFPISEGAHLAESDAPFGILNIGYTQVTSYAYPGGLKLKIINPQ